MASKKQPTSIEPMLATLTDKPFNHEDWLYEVKWDGYRIIAHVDMSKVRLDSRGLQNYTSRYPPVADALRLLGIRAILDGEVVVMNEEGRPDFDELQRYHGQLPIQYYVFDVLWLNGKDLTGLPLTERKEKLAKLIPADHDVLKFSDSFEDGLRLFEQMKAMNMEGIVAKRKNSTYLQGKRTADWLKMPTSRQQEFVVGGWAESTSGRAFRTLLFGYYEKGKLIYQGHAGGGFKEKELPGILKRLQKLETKKSPFSNPDVVMQYTETPVHWVKPQLVIQVKYATTTKSGMIRKPATFLGFREDKDPNDVVLERAAKDLGAITPKKTAAISGDSSKKREITPKTTDKSNWPILEKIPVTNEDTVKIEGHELRLTNIEKDLWKGIHKAQLITYYHAVVPYILPHLQNRPLSLHIKHLSPTAPGMYIKDMEGRQPSWAEVFTTPRKHKKDGARDVIDYLVCNEEPTLLWLVNLGCIDVNPWTSTTQRPEEPDFIIIDLDPSDDNFMKAITAAQAAKEVFAKLKLTTFPKTSGKTGIHLFVPCRGINFPQARRIAEGICELIQRMVPEITTTAVSINSRGNKLYLDPNQNDFADTVASAYSVRPFHLPTVSTPLEWKEVKRGLDPHAFTIETIFKRLEKKGDLFAGVLDQKTGVSNGRKLVKLL